MVSTYDITVYQGATFQLKMTISNAAGVLTDLTGHVFSGQIRRTVSSATAEASFTFTILNQVTNTGEVLCVISNTATAAIVVDPSPKAERKNTDMAYDIESVSAGVTTRWLQGIATIVPEATR